MKTSAVHNGVGQGGFSFGCWPALYKDATIKEVNDDETFDVLFDDDDETKKMVPLNEIQIQNVSV